MRILILFLYALCLSCEEPKPSYEEEACRKTNRILKVARTKILNKHKVTPYRSLNEMDSVEYQKIWTNLVKTTAKVWYEKDVAIVITPDCLKKSNEKGLDEIEIQQALRDSVYHSILVKKLEQIRSSFNTDDINHLGISMSIEQMRALCKELRSFCSIEAQKRLEAMTEEIEL